MIIILSSGVVFSGEGSTVNAKDARQRLLDGNKRYVGAQMTHPNQTSERRQEVSNGQHPFAVVISCSDSRVPPEVLFDQGLGDIFVIRLAGNIVNDAALGSIEYAVEHLGVGYIMVLGHEKCGAVEATVKGGEAPGHIGALTGAIQPAVDKAKGLSGDLVDNAVRINAIMVVRQLKTSAPILEEKVKKGELVIEGGRYDFDDGVVEMLRGDN
ncbi:Carbonic anhydrase [uncultured Desulfobacterium sp.]|uniref:Carbonic anhydrase n=1 Tax=uncultured Desulfobacterium sp. TaxID=201089 RepID=A0A445N0Y0_9BACT|nr:Carbonic anhydrase [uncultured Desulfobacterium sp.]